MKKNYTQRALMGFAIAVLLAGGSCKKSKTTPDPPPATVSFTLKDTLIIASAYAATDPDIYTKYNGKTYAVSSKDKTVIIARNRTGAGQEDFKFFFQDSSVYTLQSYFDVNIRNASVNSFQAEYDLADASKIQLHYHQRLKDGSVAVNMNGKVISGILKIRYDEEYKTVSGEITNLRMPIDFYTPEDTAQQLPTRSNILILEGGSYRTVSLTFRYAKVDDVP